MTFTEYQEAASHTAIYKDNGNTVYISKSDKKAKDLNWVYPMLGLSAETGELANKLKKIIRDSSGNITNILDLQGELGDILWYVSTLATELGIDLEMLAQQNIYKLHKRQIENTISGSGDNR